MGAARRRRLVAGRLAQALANLLNNAIKYSEPGGPIRLSAARQGDEAVIRVKDEGLGIPTDMLARVFDMFTRVDRSPQKGQGGLGIGLAVVKQLVEMHGGRVAARSAGPGCGSEFVVRLPVAAPAAGAPAAPSPAPAHPAAGTGARRRILVVDDNQDAADTMALMLTMMGHEARTAHDGAAGV